MQGERLRQAKFYRIHVRPATILRARAPAGRQSFRGPAPRAWHEGSAGGAAAAGAASGDQKLARAPNQGLKAPLRAHEYEAALYICGPPGPGARRIGGATANREAAGRRAGRAAGRGVGRGERPEAAAAGAAPADMSAAPGRRGTEPGWGRGEGGREGEESKAAGTGVAQLFEGLAAGRRLGAGSAY